MATGFWNSAPEVNRKFRWYMNFSGTGIANMQYALKKAAKPTMKIADIKHKYLNHEFHYPGRVEWDPIQISFAQAKIVGAPGETSISALYNILLSSGYIYPTLPASGGPTNIKTISKVKAIGTLTGNAKGGSFVSLVQINAEGQKIEEWRLFNPFFTDVKLDSLDYSSEEILNLDCTIKYDYATLNNTDGSVLLGDETQ